jgi:inorganic pyrophosphatase
VQAVVETPGGSRNKFKWDEEAGVFRLHKILPMGSAFPFDFGFIPGTMAEDGDPIDVLVVGEEPTFTGCVVGVRLIGVLEARQTERGTSKSIRNDRLIGTPEGEKIRPAVRSIDDLPARTLDQIEHFFVSYNRYEGRTFRILGRRGPRAARGLLEEARRKCVQGRAGEKG